MREIILFTAFFFCLQFVSCQQKSKNIQSKTNDTNLITNNFFKEFSIIYGDDGLLETGNLDIQKGGYEIYLTSKYSAKNWFINSNKNGNYKAILKKINQLTPDEISKDFNIWVFYTDKKYLIELEDGSLGSKIPGVIDLYVLKAGVKTWQKVDDYKLKEEQDRLRSFTWKQKKIQEIVSQSNTRKAMSLNSSSPTVNLSDKWIGKYTGYYSYGEIGGENTGWVLDLEILNDTIKVNGEGYQIGFSDLLSAKEDGNKLILDHLKNLSGYDLGKKMSPEIILIENKGKYFIKTKWIDNDIVTKQEELGYEIIKNK